MCVAVPECAMEGDVSEPACPASVPSATIGTVSRGLREGIPRLSTRAATGAVRGHRRSWRRPFPDRPRRIPGAVQQLAASLI